MFALKNIQIITPFRIIDNGILIVEDKMIIELGRCGECVLPPGIEVYDLTGLRVAPGFIDLLVHGGAGYGFADPDQAAIGTISNYFFSHGTTGLLAGLFAKPPVNLAADMDRIATYIEDTAETNVWGIHMEGPFINKEMKGAMNEEWLWNPDVERWHQLFEASRGKIRLMTIAPELPGVAEVLRAAARDGVVLSIGHTTAAYEDIEVAIDNGAAHVTHMFNAMLPLHHRDPGLVAAALLHNELKLELIADGFHVHPAVMKLLYKTKGAGGIILITDSIRAGGMPEGEYTFADQKVYMRAKKAYLEDGTLAGSTLTLDVAVKNMVLDAGVPICDAVRMASLNGAKVLGLSNRKGILAVGKEADFVVLDPSFDVQMTVYQGKIKYRTEKIPQPIIS